VDLVSDSEEDEPDVEVVEEQAIIESEEDEDDEDLQTTPRPNNEHDQESWNGFDLDTQSTLDVLDETFFDDHISRTHAPNHSAEAALWAGSEEEPVRKNVRFDISDSSDDDDENYGFPDLFVAQENLDAGFLRQIESDEDQLSDSFWDFGAEKEARLEGDDDADSDSSTGTYSSCSEAEDCR